jgi:phosphate:Na+ symporter
VNEAMSALIPMLLTAIGGLGIFMLGMKNMSEGMQAVAGNSLRRMIAAVTNNRFSATAAGTGVTVLVQSSTVTTVIVIGLVNAGLMKLHQAVGVIFGANIGTTITGWILVLQIGKYGLPMLGAAALFYIFARRDKPRFLSMAIMGLGMAFFGLELMKNGFAPMKDIPVFVEAFAWFDADSYWGIFKCIMVGCILTLIVQSSSATLGITIGLAATGVIPFQTAAALVLGENIGTTITVVLAAIGGTTTAKRAAAAHVLFNVLGVLWIAILFPWYVRFIAGLVEGMHGADPLALTYASAGDPVFFATVVTAAIALTHSGFNITNTLLFIPFFTPFTRMLERIFPEPEAREIPRLLKLDPRSVSAPVLAVEQSRGEVVGMGQGALKMMEWMREAAWGDRPEDRMAEPLVERIYHREEVLDAMQQEIAVFLTDTLDATVPHAVASEARQQLRMAHEYESAGDRMASILRALGKLREQGHAFDEPQVEGLRELHDAVAGLLGSVSQAYANRRPLEDADFRANYAAVTRKLRGLREGHLRDMTERKIPPTLSLAYGGVLTDYRRIRAHALNIHETMMEAVAPNPAG